MGATQLGIAVPNFWFGMLLVLVFAVALRWFGAGGFPGWEAGFWAGVKALTLPAIALALPQASILARVLRSALIETLGQDYIRTARAKGFSERAVVALHALKPAMIPVVTVIGLAWAHMLGGAFIVEVIFAIPGLGRMSVDAIFQKDFPVMQATLIAVSLNVLVVNLLVDILYGYLDPRVRVQR
jgi:peptide/nickel transport system permease protein